GEAPSAAAAGSRPRDDSESADGDADGDAESARDSDAAPPVDSDLLSNEEQVLRLIESEGGRMKQKQVAEELDWTAAKTSQVVTGLRDEGDLDGFRLGRENVLSLPDYDPEADSGEDDGDGNGGGGNGGDEESAGTDGSDGRDATDGA
ncbi:MAG: helix-turn-helix transcriptional regulator, partial [Halorubrum sp.]